MFLAALVDGLRVSAGDFRARKPQHQIGVMHTVADDGADLFENIFRHPPRQIATRVHRHNFADFTRFNFCLGCGVARIESADMTCHEKGFSSIGSFNNFLAIFLCRSHGLFQENMFARFNRGQRRRGVLIPHRGDANRIDIGIGQQLVVIGIGFRNTKSLGNLLQSLGRARA